MQGLNLLEFDIVIGLSCFWLLYNSEWEILVMCVMLVQIIMTSKNKSNILLLWLSLMHYSINDDDGDETEHENKNEKNTFIRRHIGIQCNACINRTAHLASLQINRFLVNSFIFTTLFV